MEGKRYKNEVAEMHYKAGIMYVVYTKGQYPLAAAEAHIEDLFREYAGIFPILAVSDISSQKNPLKEVRDFMGSAYVTDQLKASAIVADSIFSRMIGNLYLTFSRPSTPTKMFADVASAEEWLRTFP